jgi:pimeloyl-ACP methyl ester carboxylesterase
MIRKVQFTALCHFMQPEPLILSRDGDATIAYREVTGNSPTVVYCGGYHSDMTGSKAAALSTWCIEDEHAYIRFDYQGHGASSGEFTGGSIGLWRDDALPILDRVATGPVVLVGSSMGA